MQGMYLRLVTHPQFDSRKQLNFCPLKLAALINWSLAEVKKFRSARLEDLQSLSGASRCSLFQPGIFQFDFISTLLPPQTFNNRLSSPSVRYSAHSMASSVIICSTRDESGGAVELVCWPPDRAIWIRALAGDIALCSWARHFFLRVSLSTQVYKWVPVNLMLGVTLRWTSILSRGGVAILQLASWCRNRDKPGGPCGSYADVTRHKQVSSKVATVL